MAEKVDPVIAADVTDVQTGLGVVAPGRGARPVSSLELAGRVGVVHPPGAAEHVVADQIVTAVAVDVSTTIWPESCEQ